MNLVVLTLLSWPSGALGRTKSVFLSFLLEPSRIGNGVVKESERHRGVTEFSTSPLEVIHQNFVRLFQSETHYGFTVALHCRGKLARHFCFVLFLVLRIIRHLSPWRLKWHELSIRLASQKVRNWPGSPLPFLLIQRQACAQALSQERSPLARCRHRNDGCHRLAVLYRG